MLLKTFLESNTKASLQSYYLYWLPGNQMVSAKDKLAVDLLETMTDQEVVRQRFDSLGRSHRSFLVGLLAREGYEGTVDDVRSGRHGRQIEDFEVESVVRTLVDDGYVLKRAERNGNGREEIFVIPNELGDALRRTVAIEDRDVLEMLSGALAGEESADSETKTGEAEEANVEERVAGLEDEKLREAALRALRVEHGILRHSAYAESAAEGSSSKDGVFPQSWREDLERAGLGTTGVVNLKGFGILLEEDALLIFQQHVLADSLEQARKLGGENEVELFLASDFVIDLERFIEILRTENLEITREGKLYKKTEERIASSLITSRYSEVFETSTVTSLLEVSRRLSFFDVEENRLVPIALRRRGWQKKTLFEKVKLLYEHFVQDHNGARWSFHQEQLRGIFIDQLQRFHPGEWLAAQPFLTAVLARFLLGLEDSVIRKEFQRRCEDDRHGGRDGIGETLMVDLARLQHDLSYWIIHRMVLLGILDVGYSDGVIRAFRLSDLGQRFYGLSEWDEEGTIGKPALVNPDFEVLVFPDAPMEDDANLALSRFADRQDSERVRRYRLTRESVQRGVVCGMTGDEIVSLLAKYSRTQLPENVEFSVKEWTDGIELVRRQKVLLLRAVSAEGMDRLVAILTENSIPFERLTPTAITVRGSKNEKAIRDLRDEFRNEGLFIE